jgi:hypothetical protein
MGVSIMSKMLNIEIQKLEFGICRGQLVVLKVKQFGR